jgi:hypothetical protein
MSLKVEDLENQADFRQLVAVPYNKLIDFVLDYLRRRTSLMVLFWSACIFLAVVSFTVRINIAGHFPIKAILMHSLLGFVILPLLCIPVHELLHVMSFLLTGARRIRIGADLRQYMFYVTAHRHVVSSGRYSFVALTPFFIINIGLLILIFLTPGLWKWSLSLLLFVHTTMCAGDFALLNFLWINRKKKIYTWDDADQKIAYFYEEL